MSLLQVTDWNYKRNNLEFNKELERNMLDEEAKEFTDALKMYLNNSLFKLEAIVDMVDAYCDFNFIYTGTIAKMLDKPTWIDEEKRMMYMNTYIIEILYKHGVMIFSQEGKSVIDYAMEYVIEANESKPIKKTNGKVSKGNKWVDPKDKIKELLLNRGWNDDVEEVKAKREAAKINPTLAGTMEDFVATEGGQD